jgi:hypothetical protein
LNGLAQATYSAIDIFTNLKGNGTDYSGYTISDAYIYVTFTLKWHEYSRYGDALNTAMFVVSDSAISSDIRTFKFDYFSGELVDSTGDTIVTKEDVTNSDGDVVDRVVTDVVTTDGNGNTVNYYTYNYTYNTDNSTTDNSTDNSNSSKTYTTTNNVVAGNDVSTGTGSGSGGSDDKSTDSLLKKFSLSTLLTWILALFGVGDSNEGILSLIGKIFVWMPDEFVVILVGGIAVIITISIIKHIKGGDS